MPLGTSTNDRNRFAEHPKAAEYALKFQGMFGALMANVANFLTPEVNVAQVYKTGNGHVQEFIRYLSLFINSCLKSHLSMLEQGMPRANNRVSECTCQLGEHRTLIENISLCLRVHVVLVWVWMWVCR